MIGDYINDKLTYEQGHPVKWVLLHLECIFEKRRRNLLNGGSHREVKGIYLVLKQNKKTGDRSAGLDWNRGNNIDREELHVDIPPPPPGKRSGDDEHLKYVRMRPIDSYGFAPRRKSIKNRYSPRYMQMSSEKDTRGRHPSIHRHPSASREPKVDAQYPESKEQESWPVYLPRSVSFKEPEAAPARYMQPHYVPAPRPALYPATHPAPYPAPLSGHFPGSYPGYPLLSPRPQTDYPSFAPPYPGLQGSLGYADLGPQPKPEFPPYLDESYRSKDTILSSASSSPNSSDYCRSGTGPPVSHHLNDISEPSDESIIEIAEATDTSESSEDDVRPSRLAHKPRKPDKEVLEKILKEYVNPLSGRPSTKIDTKKGHKDAAGDKAAGETPVAVGGALDPGPINEFDSGFLGKKEKKKGKKSKEDDKELDPRIVEVSEEDAGAGSGWGSFATGKKEKEEAAKKEKTKEAVPAVESKAEAEPDFGCGALGGKRKKKKKSKKALEE
ncbi:MAG: hypothetical protein Q9181_008112, partial [Wetmoreana brouardii]